MVSGLLIISGCGPQTKTPEEAEKAYQGIIPADIPLNPISQEEVDSRLAIYAPFQLSADVSHLSDNQKQLLVKLFDVAKIMDDLFWRQAIGCKNSFLERIGDENVKRFAMINYGPWDRLNNNQPFISGIGEKPEGANFYPVDMTREEFEAYGDPNKASLYTLIRRDENGSLQTVWYHEAYASQLQEASRLMKEAAQLADDPFLKKYLEMRADALTTDEFQASDFAWMEMKTSDIDFVVGPIENYEDQLFGYKTAYESFILLKDIAWSKKLEKFSAMLPALQAGLPVKDEYKKDVPGSDADMNVYDVIYYAGDCNAGSKTIAINLPNDEEVHVKVGSRKLQLKNAMQAKFDKILLPISDVLIDPAQRQYVKFNAFFENTMFHEVGHAMGIKNTISGKGTARESLKEQYSAIEEGKADIMGLYLVTKLYEMGELTEGQVMDNYVTFFAGIFRSSRFGAASAHGKANMMRFNYFQEMGAFTRNDDGTYTVNFEKMQEAMVNLMQKILYIQGDGDYETAKAWVEKSAIVSPQLQEDLDRLNASDIPVDIVFEQGVEVAGL
ncbi:MAG: Zn-dependent hydrolase [Bacteroidetes bacterium]|nr:Zn-dependent hydrolase [Bacteroidota bacterium]